MAFVAAAAIGGGAGLIGGYFQSQASKDAAQKQADAANRATEMQWKMFNMQRDDQEPWRKAGMGALTNLQDEDLYRYFNASDFQKDPGYDFRMNEGQKALERSASARGGLMGGAFGKALSRYSQDYASNEYQNARNNFNNDRSNRFNRLSSIAGLGQTANSQVGAAGQNYANQAGQNMMGAANAYGAAGIASANAYGGALSQFGNNIFQGQVNQSWMDKQQKTGNGVP